MSRITKKTEDFREDIHKTSTNIWWFNHNYQYRFLESALIPEGALPQFLVDNIIDNMKFKVGDMVRLTRKGIKEIYGIWTDHNPVLIQGWVIEKIEDNLLSIDWTKKLIHKNHFEPIPEEIEFEYWEEIEVGDDDWRREKRIFLLKIPWNVIDPYVVVEWGSNERFQFGGSYDVEVWKFARKAPPNLSRKEIAEKFWVSENFVLVD